MKNTFVLLPFLALIAIASCTKKDDTSVPDLAGTWQERESGPAFAGSTYWLHFTGDGKFEARISLFTDAISVTDACANPRVQYAFGTYTVVGNVLTMNGVYSDSSFSRAVPDCRLGDSLSVTHTLQGLNGDVILDEEQGEQRRIYMVRQ